jgi:rhodanese-related sulfurtransferase
MSYERRRPRRRSSPDGSRRGAGAFLRRPAVQIFIVLVLAAIVYLIAVGGGGTSLPREISTDQAYQKYQQGAYFLDVRTQEEWNEYHAPNTTLIPLDQLPSRLSEIPRDKEIVVVCRSGNRSQQGRDILLSGGFSPVTSMAGGLNEWRDKGYPITTGP